MNTIKQQLMAFDEEIGYIRSDGSIPFELIPLKDAGKHKHFPEDGCCDECGLRLDCYWVEGDKGLSSKAWHGKAVGGWMHPQCDMKKREERIDLREYKIKAFLKQSLELVAKEEKDYWMNQTANEHDEKIRESGREKVLKQLRGVLHNIMVVLEAKPGN